MRGGKRKGAGRKRGPQKKLLQAMVLPQTMKEISRRAATKRSLGDLMDEHFSGETTSSRPHIIKKAMRTMAGATPALRT